MFTNDRLLESCGAHLETLTRVLLLASLIKQSSSKVKTLAGEFFYSVSNRLLLETKVKPQRCVGQMSVPRHSLARQSSCNFERELRAFTGVGSSSLMVLLEECHQILSRFLKADAHAPVHLRCYSERIGGMPEIPMTVAKVKS